MQITKNLYWSVAAYLLLAFAVYIQFVCGYTGDKQMELLLARMWLSGKQLYVDIFAVSPPLIFWLYALPVTLSSHLTFIKDYQVLVLAGLCVTAISVTLSAKIIRLHPRFADNPEQRAQFVLLLLLVFVFFTSPAYFFDREHIFLVLVFPYILHLLPTLKNAPLSLRFKIAIGVMAGIGFCMKPHCALVFAGVQLAYIVQHRTWRILISAPNILIYSIAAAYLLAVWIYTPEYFTVVLPMALATYSACSRVRDGLVFLVAALFSFALTFIEFRLRARSPYQQDIFYFLMITLVLLLYALMNNGWGYSYRPLISILLITNMWVLWEQTDLKRECLMQGLSAQRALFGIRGCWLNFAIHASFALLVFFQIAGADCTKRNACAIRKELITEVKLPGRTRSFGAISIDFSRWVNLSAATGAEWNTRFIQLWMLPKFLASDADFTAKHQWILEYVASAFAEDMKRNKPDIMFVDDSNQFYSISKNIDLVAYLSVFPMFKKEWEHYHFIRSIDKCKSVVKRGCKYDVYEREN